MVLKIHQKSSVQRWLWGSLCCSATLLIMPPTSAATKVAQSDGQSPVIVTIKASPLAQTPAPPDPSTPSTLPAPIEAVPTPSEPSTPQPSPEFEPRVLVSEVSVIGVEGQLLDEVFQTIRIRPGWTTTRTELQEDINAINATGYFSNVRAVPEDTPLGVKVTFEVQLNPVFQKVQLEGATLLPEVIVADAFSRQYGQVLNLGKLQEGIKKVNQWYQDNDYVLAQVINEPQVTPDGIVTLQVLEGVIEDIQVRFVDGEGKEEAANGNPVQGRILPSTIVSALKLKPGDILNRATVEQNLEQVLSLGGFEDVKLAIKPGQDPRKVIVVAKVVEIEETAANFRRLAKKLVAEVEKESDKPKAEETAKRAIAFYQKALKLLQADRAVTEEAKTLNELAVFYRSREQYPQALDTFERSLTIGKTINAPRWQAYTLFQIARTYDVSGDKDRAIDLYKQAQSRLHAIKTLPTEIGPVEQQLASEEAAAQFFVERSSDKGVKLNLDLKGPPMHFDGFVPMMTFVLLMNQSETYRSVGEYQQSLYTLNQVQLMLPSLLSDAKQHAQSAAVATPSEPKNLEALSLFPLLGMGMVYADLGQAGRAQDILSQIQQELPKDPFILNTLSSIANVAIAKTDNQQVLTAFVDQVTQAFADIQDPQAKAFSLILVGLLNQQVDQNQKAVEAYQQAVSLLATNSNPALKQFRASAFNSMGEVWAKMGKPSRALDAYQQALALQKEFSNRGGQATTLYNIGMAQLDNKTYDAALESFNQALSLNVELKDPQKEADTRLGVAIAERGRGNFSQARSQVEQAISSLESSSVQAAAPVENQTVTNVNKSIGFQSYIDLATYFASKQNYYQFYVDLLMQQHWQQPTAGYAIQAFEASERSRARSLLGILRSANDRPPQQDLSNQYSRDATLDQPPNLAIIQQQLLDNDTLLLEYVLGDERSYVWAVDKKGFAAYELPSRATIEAAARSFYNFLTVPSQRLRPTKATRAGIVLSQILLGPVASKLRQRQLVIVADGFLQYLPFGALPVPKPVQARSIVPSKQIQPSQSTTMMVRPDDVSAWEPLLMQNEVVSLPSVSTLSVIRRLWGDRPRPSKNLAVLADPVFSPTDERLARAISQPASQPKEASPTIVPPTAASPLLGYSKVDQFYPRLKGTAQEAQQILALVPAAERLESLGFAATRQIAVSPDLGQYRILHFATHGLLDSSDPARSGVIFSIFNSQGELQRSSLTTIDVFKLKLGADLVVLSGCRTGLGKEVQGEGLIGLTGGLMYAGARRVLVSLWSVDDEVTSELMTRFYRGMLQDKLVPSKALRAAQLSMQQDPRWQSPYYWAAFTLQGDWR